MTSPHRILIGAIALVVLGGSALPVRASADSVYRKQLDQNVSVAADTPVTIENMAGEVSVTQGGQALEVHATVVAGGGDQSAARTLADSIRLDVDRDGGHVKVHVHYPVDKYTRYQYIPTNPAERKRSGIHVFGLHFGYSSSDFEYQGRRVSVYRGKSKGVPLHVDLQIRLPAGLHASIDNHMGRMHADQVKGDLSLKTSSGDIDARGITGSLTTRSGSGDISVADVNGAMNVHTGSGDVKLHRVQGSVDAETGSGDINGGDVHGDRLKLRTGSGDIMLGGLTGDLTVSTGSGDIGLRDISAVTKARIGSGSGDIDLGGDLSGMKNFEISSGSGDITLVSAHPPAVHLSISGSDIGVHWPDLRHVESGRRHFSGDIGNAGGNGRISTGSGDVSLRP